MTKKYFLKKFRIITRLSVLKDPIFTAIYKFLKKEDFLIISISFEFIFHLGPHDHYRFSTEPLKYLVSISNFKVLQRDWQFNIVANVVILNITNRENVIIKTVYYIIKQGRKGSYVVTIITK